MPASNIDRFIIADKSQSGLSAKGRSVYSAFRQKLRGSAVANPNVQRVVAPAIKGKAARDHAKTFRELVSGWSVQDLHCLVVEFDSAFALRQLNMKANRARPQSASLKEDLAALYLQQKCTDIVILYRNEEFPAHRNILRRRSTYFHHLLRSDTERTIKLNLPNHLSQVTGEQFNALLLYLYTSEIPLQWRTDVDLILKLKDFVATAHTLEFDIYKIMEQSQSDGDARLEFTPNHAPFPGEAEHSADAELEPTVSTLSALCGASGRTYQLACDCSILASRSPLLCQLLERKRSCGEEMKIVLDENIIPRIYATVIIHAMHTDQVDLTKVLRGCLVSACSLNEVQAIASGKCQIAPIDQATDIYHIARFLEFDRLAEGCEDVIISHMSIESLPSVCSWSTDSGGSAFVRRHCVQLLCSEYSKIANSAVLFDLDEQILIEALKSHFVQASELEILQSVINWGEHQLIRRMEEREPNILNGTTHSIQRKGVRRADMSDVELKQILCNLLPLVRIDYILPPFHQSLTQAISRGLVSCPPPDLAAEMFPSSARSSHLPDSQDFNPDQHWLHPSAYKGPRLFFPYMEEARMQLTRRLQENAEISAQLRTHTPTVLNSRLHCDSLLCGDDESDEENEGAIPDSRKMKMIQEKVERIMKNSTTVKQALACGCDNHRTAVLKEVRLRILREENLWDQLERVMCTHSYSCTHRYRSESQLNADLSAWPDLMNQCNSQEGSSISNILNSPPPDLVESSTNDLSTSKIKSKSNRRVFL